MTQSPTSYLPQSGARGTEHVQAKLPAHSVGFDGNKFAVRHYGQQEKVNTYFQSYSSYWKDVYAITGVQAEIIQDRHAAILAWVDSLALAPDSPVLEVGCGAGFLSVALAQRGLRVHAIDSVEAMVEQARRQAAESGTADLLSPDVGDIYALAFGDEAFDLVIANGVFPWLDQPEEAMKEVARVTRAEGYIILTTANRMGLASLLDPLMNPLLSPLKRRVKEALGCRSATLTYHSSRFIDKTLASVGFVKTKGTTRGFGFSLFRRPVLSERLSTALHHRLQHFADRGLLGFHSIGMTYFVLARKSASQSPVQSTRTEKR